MLLTLPVCTSVIALGYDLIWFGIIVVKMCEVCQSRRLGSELLRRFRCVLTFLWAMFRGIFLFFLMDALTVALFWPSQIVLWLPNLVNTRSSRNVNEWKARMRLRHPLFSFQCEAVQCRPTFTLVRELWDIRRNCA